MQRRELSRVEVRRRQRDIAQRRRAEGADQRRVVALPSRARVVWLSSDRRCTDDRELAVGEERRHVALRAARDKATEDVVTVELERSQRRRVAKGVAVVAAAE